MERSIAITAAVILAVLALPAAGQAGDHSPQTDRSATIVEVGDANDRLWPFTSRSTSFEGRTLVINVIVTAEPSTTRRLLGETVPGEWTRTDPARTPLGARLRYSESDPSLRWRHAHGAVRYTYIETGDGEGRWLSSQYQLHVGTYLGSRHHVRAFGPDESSSWTALQAHSEYWDWFRLRHTVTDVHGTADMLESEFRDSDARIVERRHTREPGPLSNGIVVVGALVSLLVGLTVHREWAAIDEYLPSPARRNRTLAVFGLAAGSPLAIRVVGIGLSDGVALSPKLFVAVLYPCLALGLPVAVTWSALDLPPWLAAPAAGIGLALGFALDFAVLGVTPQGTILRHRLLVAGALGLLAAGGGFRRPLSTAAGAVVWVWGLSAPLLGLL